MVCSVRAAPEAVKEDRSGLIPTFFLFVVRYSTFRRPLNSKNPSSIQVPKGNKRILLIHDEEATVVATQMTLERLGYRVTTRTGSIEVLEAFRHNPLGFDLVITDMTMPNMTGKELAMKLMAIRPNMPIILCTGFSEKIGEKRAKEMGIRAFVMKPTVMSQIANTIREVLGGK